MGYDGLELQRKAAAAGIVILPGTLFSPTKEYARCVRIACGHPFGVIKPALVTLAKLLAGRLIRPQNRAGGS